MPENDYVKLAFDAQQLNPLTDPTFYSWPLEPVKLIRTGENDIIFSISALSDSYRQLPLTSENQKLITFITGG